MLASRAGKAELPVSPLQGDLEKIPDLNPEIVDRIVTDRPTGKRGEQEVSVAQARLKDARRESVPDLHLRAREQCNGVQVGTNPANHLGAQSFATAGIDIPLWNRNHGNIEAPKPIWSVQKKMSHEKDYEVCPATADTVFSVKS